MAGLLLSDVEVKKIVCSKDERIYWLASSQNHFILLIMNCCVFTSLFNYPMLLLSFAAIIAKPLLLIFIGAAQVVHMIFALLVAGKFVAISCQGK